jgi:flagellar biosynthesis protein FlhG
MSDMSFSRPVIAVGSGKGGVGKSIISVSLACAFARRRDRILLVDGSHNQGNLHVLLGTRPPARMEGVLDGRTAPEEMIAQVSDRISLLPIDSGAPSLYRMSPVDRARLHLRLTRVFDSYNVVVIDAGPGIESPMLAMMRANRLVVVAVPEPASLSDAYALIKIATLRAPGLPIDVIINRTLSEAEGIAAFGRCDMAAQRFLKRTLGYLGSIGEIGWLREAVREPGRILRERIPECESIAARLLDSRTDEAGAAPAFVLEPVG